MLFHVGNTVEFENTDIVLAALQRFIGDELDGTAVDFFANAVDTGRKLKDIGIDFALRKIVRKALGEADFDRGMFAEHTVGVGGNILGKFGIVAIDSDRPFQQRLGSPRNRNHSHQYRHNKPDSCFFHKWNNFLTLIIFSQI